MNKAYILMISLALPCHLMAAEQDSVYSWGAWSKGLQPAAGSARVTPPPAMQPDVNFRANENSTYLREITTQLQHTLYLPAPAVIPGAPQTPDIFIVPSGSFSDGSTLP